MSKSHLLLSGLLCTLLISCAEAPAAPGSPAERCGLAAEYPGDMGIADDPSVLFHEDFEHGSVDELHDRWSSIRNPGNLSFVPDVPPHSAGRAALLMRSIGGQDTGAHLYRNLEPGVDQVHLRYSVRYASAHRYHHSGGTVGGYNPPTPWPQGGAGTRPDGGDRLTIRFEPIPSGRALDFYAYWMEMRGNPGDESFWGNTFLGDRRPAMIDREWRTVEIAVTLNDPASARNGELALWIDGERVAHLAPGHPVGEWVWDSFVPADDGIPFEGFRWRSDPSLALNFVWLTHYVTGHKAGEVSEIWFDDVVVATEFVGPVGGALCSSAPESAP